MQMLDPKHLENFEMWCWRTEKISWTYPVGNEEVLLGVKEKRNISHTIEEGRLTGLVIFCAGTAF
jgi:hypothetical protein